MRSDCLESQVACETVYGDMLFKRSHGIIRVRVGNCIPVPDLYLVIYGPLLPNLFLYMMVKYEKINYLPNTSYHVDLKLEWFSFNTLLVS